MSCTWFAALLLPLSALSQELGLKDYARRLPEAPGATIEQKVEMLSYMGVRLSNDGFRDLQRLTTPPGGFHTPRIGGIDDSQDRFGMRPSHHRVADAFNRVDTHAAAHGAFGNHMQPGSHPTNWSTMSPMRPVPWESFRTESIAAPGHSSGPVSHFPQDNFHPRSPGMPDDIFQRHGIGNQWTRPDPFGNYPTRQDFSPWSSPMTVPGAMEGRRIENGFGGTGFQAVFPGNDRWVNKD